MIREPVRTVRNSFMQLTMLASAEWTPRLDTGQYPVLWQSLEETTGSQRLIRET
jgi:hypothetical protein